MNFITVSYFLIKICSFVIPESISFRMNTLAFYLQLGIPVISIIVGLVYCLNNWSKSLFRRLISLLLLVMAFGLLINFAALHNYFLIYPHISRTGFIFVLLFPTLLYFSFYFGLLKHKFRRIDLLHFLPLVIYIINYLPFFFTSGVNKIKILQSEKLGGFNEGWLLPSFGAPLMSLAFNLFYIHLFVKQLNTSSLKSIQIKKLYFFIGYLVIHCLPMLFMFLEYYEKPSDDNFGFIFYATINIFFFSKLIATPEWLFYNEKEMTSDDFDSSKINTSPLLKINSRLTPRLNELSKKENEMIIRLLELCYENKLFLDADFNQKKLANLLQTSEYKIRILLEKAYGLNFVEYNNLLKIKYLIENYPKKRKTWKRTKIENLATELGYKSLNSFYINFKKIVGITPGEYFKQQDGMLDNNKVKVETV